jgi:hypothetical protein
VQIGAKDDQLKTKDGEISRYRVACGLEPASKGALVQLNNAELTLKAQSVVAKLRKLDSHLDARLKLLDDEARDKKISKGQAFMNRIAAQQEMSKEFQRTCSSDAYNVDNELRSRFDPKAIAHVLEVPALITDDADIPISEIAKGTGFDVFYFGKLADEIEQMAILLPPDKK